MTLPQPEPVELDPNKIVAEFMQANVERVIGIGGRHLKGARDRVRVKLTRTYSEYIRRLVERHSRAKSFFVRTEPIPLYDFFVPLDLATDRQRLSSPGAANIAAVAPFAILTGSGGSGKSMIMRHILLSALASHEKTPVFLELRTLDLNERSLEEALLTSLVSNGLDVDAAYFQLALNEGHFLILLDGYDELDRRARSKVAAAVQALAERHPRNWLVLSSRPDPELEGWTAFTVFRVEPLDLPKAVALVEHLSFDVDIKTRFVTDLKADLFNRHQSFLSNPLLLSIMLLTYHDTAHIPTKLSIFYNQAYESLFQKHDALKGGYQRQRRTPLDIQDFARVFAAFCVRTYNSRQFTFSVLQALAELERAKQLTRIEFVPADFLSDAQQAVCLLVEEGADTAFAHRSFQEYFAARFVAAAPPPLKSQLIKRFGASVGTDAVMPLLYEMDAYAVEQHYILPTLQRLRAVIDLKRTVGTVHHKKYLKALFTTFQISSDGKGYLSATIGDSALFHALRFIHEACAIAKPQLNVSTDDAVRLGNLLTTRFPSEQRVSMGRACSDKEFYGAVKEDPDMFGITYLKEVLATEATIRSRHSATEGSLESILG